MNTHLKLIVFTIATLCLAVPARAAWHVKYFEGRNQSADSIQRDVAAWINEQKPKDLNSIKGFISQSLTGGKGGDYNIYVFVDSAEGDQASIKVKVAQHPWLTPTKKGPGSTAEEFIPTLERDVVILGFYGGQQANSIFYVYQVK